MSINVNDKFPNVTVKVMGEKGPQDVSTQQLLEGKKVVLFAVPGAFTPGCTLTHLPGYVVLADKIKAKGVDSIICLSVNDAEELIMLADGNGELTRALGLEMDGTGYGMGKRSQRYAMIIDNGVIKHLAVEPKGGVDVSAAEKILALL